MKWYGSIDNRIEENKMFCEEIKVGIGMTEYLWSDRHAYEVVDVKDQKHVWVRQYDTKSKDGVFASNNWELISNEDNPILYLTKRGKHWYWTVEITKEMLETFENLTDEHEKIKYQMFFAENNVMEDDRERIRTKGKIRRYTKANVSFGVADYYYDYSF